MFYANPASAAGAVVLDGRGRVLLVRRALEPFRGSWSLPAGYQDFGEEPMEAARRETLEEAGIELGEGELLDLVHVPDDPRKPANVAFYLFEVGDPAATAGDDAAEAAWFELDELPEDIAFGNRERLLDPLRSRPRVQELRARAKASEGALSYRDAGVNIDAAEKALSDSKASIRASFTAGVAADVGLFGGLFDLRAMEAEGELLVASADGVGTKLEIARRCGIYDTVGRDLVQHCINDILVQGARPHFFMDYVGVGELDSKVVSEIIVGFADACRDNGLALLGGETAEMPGTYAPGDFDLVGFIVGSVRRDRILDGSRVEPGQVLLGLESSGLHTNGYSLARKIVFDRLGHSVDDRPEALGGRTIGEALLEPHRSYLKVLWPLLEEERITGLAHITGGGLRDNLPRILGTSDALIRRGSWPEPPLFTWLCEAGDVPEEERYRAFNMGIGMVLCVDAADVDVVREHLESQGEAVHRLGETATAQGSRGQVRWVD